MTRRARPGRVLPRGEGPRPALRRHVLHRRPHHRHLLPALLPGDHPAAAQRGVLPDRRGAPRAPASGPAAAACPTPPPARPSGTSRPTSPPRAMRLVADGVVEREGVDGLARRLGYSTRQLNRVVTQEYGAGPLALARSRRAQTARVLIETTDLTFADIAFAAGFASVRQFNDTVREVYAATPTRAALRGRPRRAHGRLRHDPHPHRRPRAVRRRRPACASSPCTPSPGSRPSDRAGTSAPSRLPHGPGVVRLDLGGPTAGQVPCTVHAGRRPRPGARHGARPPAARRRLRPGRGRRGAGRGPAARPARRADDRDCACPASSTAPRWPCRPCWGSRSAWPRPAPRPAGSSSEYGDPLGLERRPRW